MAFLKRLALVLTTGYIFLLTSELVFWSAHGDIPLTTGEFCVTWLAWKAGVRWHTSWVVYLATVPAGLFTYVYAVVSMLFLGPGENGRCSCFFKARRAGASP